MALRAIAEIGANPLKLLTTVYDAADGKAASEMLIAGQGWSPDQAVVALDMQVRGLLVPHRLAIAAELGAGG
jgi:hypothetical protein